MFFLQGYCEILGLHSFLRFFFDFWSQFFNTMTILDRAEPFHCCVYRFSLLFIYTLLVMFSKDVYFSCISVLALFSVCFIFYHLCCSHSHAFLLMLLCVSSLCVYLFTNFLLTVGSANCNALMFAFLDGFLRVCLLIYLFINIYTH